MSLCVGWLFVCQSPEPVALEPLDAACYQRHFTAALRDQSWESVLCHTWTDHLL